MSERQVLNPLKAAERIGQRYRDYLVSTFRPRSPKLALEFEQAIRSSALTKGPILEASAPFEFGASVTDLIDEGLLSPLFGRLDSTTFPLERPLYSHQEAAIKKAVAGKNLIVSTGTGSGKTETFLLPILNGLLREVENGTIHQPGVRALLLYPMNALANDQVKRLRRLLRVFPEVTFGRYVGETRSSKLRAEEWFRQRYPAEPRIDNELLSREEMQHAPPRILLTNYAMLEYLLLRPADSAFFDGETGQHWRTLVLDEAHVYDGAVGTEIAYLLRRLKDRVLRSQRGVLQCFATSATLGGGRSSQSRLTAFAESLFGEKFDESDIITAKRRPLARDVARWTLPGEAFVELDRAFRGGASPAELGKIAARHGVSIRPDTCESTPAFLAKLLAKDERVIAVQKALADRSVDLAELAEQVFEGSQACRDQLVSLVDLCVAARWHDDDAPLIPARYHFWVGSLEGSYLCLHREHPEGAPRLMLGRHKHCPHCAAAGRESVMVELGVCRACGAEYALGQLEDGVLVQVADWQTPPEYLLFDGESVENDEDAIAHDIGIQDAYEEWFEPGTGRLGSGQRPPGAQGVLRIQRTERSEPLHRCVRCSTSVVGEVVYRMLTGSDAPAAVVATELYQALPPSADEDQLLEAGEGRKLLTFSDSRQDAAFFAPYLERTYRRAVVRRLIWRAVGELSTPGVVPRLADLAPGVRRGAEDALLLDPDDGAVANRREVDGWLLAEAIAWDRRLSIDGLGLAEIRAAAPRRFRTPQALADAGFDELEALAVLRVLLDSMRLQGAVTVPDGIDITDQRFAPRNRDLRFRRLGAEAGIAAWLPSPRSLNRRLEYLSKVLRARGLDGDIDARAVLEGLWDELTSKDGIWSKVLVGSMDRRRGAGWKVNFEHLEIEPLSERHRPYVCDTCRRTWWWSVDDVCPTWRCSGTLSALDDLSLVHRNHYARLYEELEVLAMRVKEHTAQWSADAASRIQDDYVAGRLNVLSCSTTFELGVDVGEVQAVLLRNVPPRPANYVQRAGRAGRRQDAAALVVTVAQRRAHDRYHFDNPDSMVEGVINPPIVELDNHIIARRHVHSVAFAAYERNLADRGLGTHSQVEEFFCPAGAAGVDDMRSWLSGRPELLRASLRRTFLPDVVAPLGVRDWSWLDALFDESPSDPTFGWLGRATGEVREELAQLEQEIDRAFAEHNGRRGEYLKHVRATLAKRYLLGFLASRNVLPKYGFPVDVVPLQLASDDELARDLELDRDLRLAIADYAPGSTIVAGGRLWRTDGIRIPPSRQLPSYAWRVCGECGAFRSALALDTDRAAGTDDDRGVRCASCDSTRVSQGGQFVVPIFGFVGSQSGRPGDSRPRRLRRIRSWFSSYRVDPPEFEVVPELSTTIEVGRRASRQGLIVTINDGGVRGFSFCSRCGRALDASRRGKAHEALGRVGRECSGKGRFAQLGHSYLTDVLEIRLAGLPDRPSEARLRSVLYAALAGVRALGIARGDVDGTVHAVRGREPSLIIYDTVAGGAGHAHHLGEDLLGLFQAAMDVVRACDCEEVSSCYGCLRDYTNQVYHDVLSRAEAKSLLELALG